MPLESPESILINEDGSLLTVSQSQELTGSAGGLLVVASSSQGATFLRASDDGTLFVSGAFQASATVVFPLSQSTLEVGGATTTLSSAQASTTAIQILAANANRKYGFLYADGNRSWFIGFGTAPTSTLFTLRLEQSQFYEIPERYTGSVFALASGGGNATLMITETTVD